MLITDKLKHKLKCVSKVLGKMSNSGKSYIVSKLELFIVILWPYLKAIKMAARVTKPYGRNLICAIFLNIYLFLGNNSISLPDKPNLWQDANDHGQLEAPSPRRQEGTPVS